MNLQRSLILAIEPTLCQIDNENEILALMEAAAAIALQTVATVILKLFHVWACLIQAGC